MPLIERKGAASSQGFGEFAKTGVATYIEDVFSTYLYTGNGSTQTITNNIDLSTKGGLVWLKIRSSANYHALFDTSRGATTFLKSNATDANETRASSLTSFNTNGFSLSTWGDTNGSGSTFASWTFRKQPKFFDVVTWSGTGTTNRVLNHSLAAKPGFVLYKDLTSATNWDAYARDTDSAYFKGTLNSTNAMSGPSATYANLFTSTTFQVTSSGTNAFNESGHDYVAYLFAHNAGGFGLTGTDNVISCSSVTTTSGAQYYDVNLGYEPQWLLLKNATGTSTAYWQIVDNMRGLTNNDVSTAVCNTLQANATNAESNPGNIQITATGFRYYGSSYSNGDTLIYIAIRRGPMKTPTSGTSVYTANNAGSGSSFTAGFPPDMVLSNDRTGSSTANGSRLIGPSLYLETNTTAAETSRANAFYWNNATGTFINDIQSFSWVFRRAPGFFDVVCYTGDSSSTRVVNHNLGVTPEMIIVKCRSQAKSWPMFTAALGISGAQYNNLYLDDSGIVQAGGLFRTANLTTTTFGLTQYGNVNDTGATYVAYLFASCPGVSKVGSYSGTGATQTISCGFAARFVLIKRTDSTGNWWVWDTSRGMVSGTDPRLALNSTSAETNANWVYTNASGFQIVTTDATVNASGGSYIYLAIA